MKKRERVLVHIRLFADQVDYAKLLGEGEAYNAKLRQLLDAGIKIHKTASRRKYVNINKTANGQGVK